jgi:hypothetical protein
MCTWIHGQPHVVTWPCAHRYTAIYSGCMASGSPVSTTLPSFDSAVSTTQQQLAEHLPVDGDTVVPGLLSNNSFIGRDEEGKPLAVFLGGDGLFHIPGTLITIPSRRKINPSKLYASGRSGVNTILVGPMLRYTYETYMKNAALIH